VTEFEQHYQKYRFKMYQEARQQGASHEQAQDAVQVAAHKLSQMSTIQYIDQNRVKGLFCAVTRHATIDKLRSEGLYQDMKTDYWLDPTTAPKVTPKRSRELHISIAVHRALAQLSELESYVAWKYWAMDQSWREITEDLRVSRGQVWYKLKWIRFIRKLRSKLKKELINVGANNL